MVSSKQTFTGSECVHHTPIASVVSSVDFHPASKNSKCHIIHLNARLLKLKRDAQGTEDKDMTKDRHKETSSFVELFSGLPWSFTSTISGPLFSLFGRWYSQNRSMLIQDEWGLNWTELNNKWISYYYACRIKKYYVVEILRLYTPSSSSD